MSIRPKAIHWFKNQYGKLDETICSSKFYSPKESWCKKSAWWIEFQRSKVIRSNSETLNFICQKGPNSESFYHLRIPIGFIIENEPKFSLLKGKKFSLWLSAETENLFQDERGMGRVHLKQFLV